MLFRSAIGNPAEVDGAKIRFKILRRVSRVRCEDNTDDPGTVSCNGLISSEWTTLVDMSEDSNVEDKPIPDGFTGTLWASEYEFAAISYDKKDVQLAIYKTTVSIGEWDETANITKEYSLPVYIIVIISVVTAIVIIVAAIVIYRKYKLVKVAADPTITTENAPNEDIKTPEVKIS